VKSTTIVATIKAAPAALISSRCRAGIGANEPLASALSTSCARVYALTAKTIARIP
jgi:lambda repressor-like predicted transcriptional regulator